MVICTAPGCQTTAGCLCNMVGAKIMSPRWIADEPVKILYESDGNGGYRPAYEMKPIKPDQ